MRSPRSTSRRKLSGPLIALVGADGSGKSTVGAALLMHLQAQRPTELRHLGKQTGNWGRAIARLPGFGKGLDRRIVKTGDVSRTTGETRLLPAAVIFALSMRRVVRFRRMLGRRRAGITILTDRFPQNVVPGPMDGPGLKSSGRNSRPVRWLTGVEHRLYRWMAAHPPDLVIRLNVDLATAQARKPDHRPASLARKISDLSSVSFNGAPILDLDSSDPLPTVIARAEAAIDAVLRRHDAVYAAGET